MIIYKATNIINNKIYIGQTINSLKERMNAHKTCSKKLNYTFYFAIRKYGFNNFKWEIIDTCNNRKELNKKEKYYIKIFKSQNIKYGYNISPGGDGGCDNFTNNPRKEEIREKMRLAKLGKKVSLETREKLRIASSQRICTKETRKKLSESKMREKNPFYGKKHTKRALNKMSESRRVFSDEKIIEIFNMRKNGYSYLAISEKFKVDEKSIWNILNFKTTYAKKIIIKLSKKVQ